MEFNFVLAKSFLEKHVADLHDRLKSNSVSPAWGDGVNSKPLSSPVPIPCTTVGSFSVPGHGVIAAPRATCFRSPAPPESLSSAFRLSPSLGRMGPFRCRLPCSTSLGRAPGAAVPSTQERTALCVSSDSDDSPPSGSLHAPFHCGSSLFPANDDDDEIPRKKRAKTGPVSGPLSAMSAARLGEFHTQADLVVYFGLPSRFRFRDARRLLVERCTESQRNFLVDFETHAQLLTKLPHRLTASHFATCCVLLAFHYAAMNGELSPFWVTMDKSNMPSLVQPQILRDFHPNVGISVHLRRLELAVAGRSESFAQSLTAARTAGSVSWV